MTRDPTGAGVSRKAVSEQYTRDDSATAMPREIERQLTGVVQQMKRLLEQVTGTTAFSYRHRARPNILTVESASMSELESEALWATEMLRVLLHFCTAPKYLESHQSNLVAQVRSILFDLLLPKVRTPGFFTCERSFVI